MNGAGVQIYPKTSWSATCIWCGGAATAIDWCVPGMWTLAHMRCNSCAKLFLMDLPYSVGLIAPCYIDCSTDEVRRPLGPSWYADLTKSAWLSKKSSPISVRRVRLKENVRDACLVNCLLPWWGDTVKLALRVNQLPNCGKCCFADSGKPKLA